MKVAIMQPYFFPYIGYFSLIANADRFIVFDTVQFIRHGWIERNRILHPDRKVLYIKVPLVSHSRQTLIKDIKINEGAFNWKGRIYDQLVPYRKVAPNFKSTMDLVKECLEINTTSIVELNVNVLHKICLYIGIDFHYNTLSEMNPELPEIYEPDEWALYISKWLGADSYVNPPGGLAFFDRKKYENHGINLEFIKPELTEYRQYPGQDFIPELSIIDVLMFNSINQIQGMLSNIHYL